MLHTDRKAQLNLRETGIHMWIPRHEFQVLEVVWDLGKSTALSVKHELDKRGAISRSRTSVRDLLTRLAERGVLSREWVDKKGPPELEYTPLFTREELAGAMIEMTVRALFEEFPRDTMKTIVRVFKKREGAVSP